MYLFKRNIFNSLQINYKEEKTSNIREKTIQTNVVENQGKSK